MALRVAVASGNWSNPSTWYLGVKPTAGDDVVSNGFTVTIDENVNVNSIANTAKQGTSIIPIMTSATAPSGTVVASSQESSAYVAWKAFDGLTGLNAWSNNRSYTGVETLEYQFPTAKIVVGYTLQTTQSNFPTAWQFQAWDGTAWVVLDTVSGATATISRTFTNTTAYTRYRIAISAPTTQFYLGELKMFDNVFDAVFASAGGGFVLTNGVTVTCTTELRSGNSTLLLWSGTTGNIITSPLAVGAGSGRLIDVAGVGTLNINITTLTGLGGVAPTLVHVGAAATVNIVGTFQVVSDLRGTMLNIAAAATVNVTGNFIRNIYTNNIFYMVAIVAINSTLNITGDIIVGNLSNYWGYDWNLSSTYNINITGTLQTILTPSADVVSIFSSVAGYLKVIGPIITYGNHVVYRNTNNSAINLFSGPFVCSTYGFVPLQVVRMHLIPNAASYFEFRDETTNGAVSPGAIAPAARLVSPGAAIDAPIPANVRSGISYASGTLLGTMIVPSPSNVANNVPVDNTVGTAILDPNAIWSVPLTSINTLNSIGRRVKNAATVETTGAQIESILNSL